MTPAVQLLQYQTAKGSVPFRNWLLAIQDVSVRARIRVRLDRLVLGNFGDCKNVGLGVFELRFHFGPGYRIYFARDGRFILLLLSGGDKSTQTSDILRAQGYWQDYLRRR